MFCASCKHNGEGSAFKEPCKSCYPEVDEEGNRLKPAFKKKAGAGKKIVNNGREG